MFRRSEAFAQRWVSYEVLQERGRPLAMHHPLVGPFVLERLTMLVEQDPLLTMRVLLPLAGTNGREQ
jgi:hypothetical protein